MKPISNRLEALVSMVTPGLTVGDVGCDHGFLSMALVGRGIAPSAIAMDLRPGPLGQAKNNIAAEGLECCIETRLSDGLAKLAPGEVDAIVIAGMGGRLVMQILERGAAVTREARELILQPQSEIPLVRHYLSDHGYRLLDEAMLMEDGKYYMLMKVTQKDPNAGEVLGEREADFLFGKKLLARKHPVLREYLQWEIGLKEEILSKLPEDTAHLSRRAEVEQALGMLRAALAEVEEKGDL